MRAISYVRDILLKSFEDNKEAKMKISEREVQDGACEMKRYSM